MSSAASSNVGRSQNGVLGNGITQSQFPKLCKLTLKLISVTSRTLADSVEQDLTAPSLQSDLGSIICIFHMMKTDSELIFFFISTKDLKYLPYFFKLCS